MSPGLAAGEPSVETLRAARRRAAAPTDSGGWRPDLPFNHNEGVKITLRREPGVTPAGFLDVPFRFHAPPTDTLPRSWRYDWTTTNTIDAGEQPREGGKQLDRLTITTMLLDQPYDWMVWDGTLDVQRLLQELHAILDKPAPFRLTMGQPALWGPRPLVNTIAAFTAVEPEQRGGYLGTEYLTCEFIQLTRQRLTESERERPSRADTERRHDLHPGDTLYSVALKVYKKRSDWHRIASANGITGVPPDSAPALAGWAAKHHRKTLRIPARVVTPAPTPSALESITGFLG